MGVMEKRRLTQKTKPKEPPMEKFPSSDGLYIEDVPLLAVPWRSRDMDSSVEFIIARAAEVIGDRDKALRWLGTPVRGLDFATPISLLGTEEGARRVDTILGQMEHGIW